MDYWYIVYPSREIESYLTKEGWESEVHNLSFIYNIDVVGNTCYVLDNYDFEEIDWED